MLIGDSMRRHLLFSVIAVLLAFPASAQMDMSGAWQPFRLEDLPERGQGPDLGDYTGYPVTEGARLFADSWDASRLTLQEHQCRVHTVTYIYRGPLALRISEIRDPETAETAVKASLTGHLVFSTVHTNTAAGVVTRLKDMGVEPFLIAATLRLSVAQRLVRKLCSNCRRPRNITSAEVFALRQPALESSTVFDAAGCVMCAGRGYTGRVALFEKRCVNAHRRLHGNWERLAGGEFDRARQQAALIRIPVAPHRGVDARRKIDDTALSKAAHDNGR